MEALSTSSASGPWRLPLRGLAALGLAITCVAPGSAGADPLREYQIKFGFLVNFARLVSWPETSLAAGEPVVIGILGNEVFAAGVKDGEQSARVDGRPVVVRRISRARDVPACHIVFLTAAEHAQAPEILKAAQGHSVLTVGETERFLGHGGMIRFFEQEGRIRFEIRATAPGPGQLQISSRLLRLGRTAGGAP